MEIIALGIGVIVGYFIKGKTSFSVNINHNHVVDEKFTAKEEEEKEPVYNQSYGEPDQVAWIEEQFSKKGAN